MAVTGKHFPDPVKEGNPFLLWCEDTGCTVEYDPRTSDMSKITDLYAKWSVVVVTFNLNGGGVSQTTKGVTFGSAYGDLPEPSRTGHTFINWLVH